MSSNIAIHSNRAVITGRCKGLLTRGRGIPAYAVDCARVSTQHLNQFRLVLVPYVNISICDHYGGVRHTHDSTARESYKVFCPSPHTLTSANDKPTITSAKTRPNDKSALLLARERRDKFLLDEIPKMNLLG